MTDMAEHGPSRTPEQREADLEARISEALGKGWQLESRAAYTAVVVRGRRPNHVLHLLLSVFTLGLWIPVWIIVAIVVREQRLTLTA